MLNSHSKEWRLPSHDLQVKEVLHPLLPMTWLHSYFCCPPSVPPSAPPCFTSAAAGIAVISGVGIAAAIGPRTAPTPEVSFLATKPKKPKRPQKPLRKSLECIKLKKLISTSANFGCMSLGFEWKIGAWPKPWIKPLNWKTPFVSILLPSPELCDSLGYAPPTAVASPTIGETKDGEVALANPLLEGTGGSEINNLKDMNFLLDAVYQLSRVRSSTTCKPTTLLAVTPGKWYSPLFGHVLAEPPCPAKLLRRGVFIDERH